MDAKEKFESLLKHYGPVLLGLLVLVLVVHDVFGTHGYLAMLALSLLRTSWKKRAVSVSR